LFLPWKILTRLEKFQASFLGFAVVPYPVPALVQPNVTLCSQKNISTNKYTYPVPASRRPMQTSTASKKKPSTATAGRFGRHRLHANTLDFFWRAKCHIGLDEATTNTGLFLPWNILTRLEKFQASCIGFAVVPYPVPASRRPMQTSTATAGRFGRRRLHANTLDFL
jgi:hypothetical protein